MDAFDIQVASFQHALEAYKVRDIVIDHGLRLQPPDWWGFKMEAYDATPYNATLFKQAGGVVALHSDSPNTVQRMYTEAAKMLRYGLTEEQVLEMITLDPAKQLGIEDKVGTLEVGKHADIAMFNKHPLDAYTLVVKTWIDGELVYDRSVEGTPMLNRRQLLQTAIAGGMLGPRLASATRPLGGVLPQQKDFRFYNATLLDAKGMVQKNWGGEVKDGVLRLSKDIKDGSDLGGKWIVPNFIDAGCTVGLYEVDLESSTHDDSESSGSEQPLLIAGDGYNPLSGTIPTIRANGIGSVILHPSFDRLVAGSMSHVYLAGVTKAETVVSERLSVCIGLGRTGKGHDGPSTRMGIAARLREIFAEMSPTPSVKQSKWRKSPDVPELTGAEAIWRKVADGELPVVFSAHRADE